MSSNKCGGLLDSKNYFRALALLKRQGIQYADVGFGFDRFYWFNGLYRVAGDKVYMVYVDNILLPFTGTHIDCRETPYSLRLGL